MTRLTHITAPRALPEFVREEYPTFVKLVEEYYKFLDQETYTGNLDSIKDIDNTPDEFIEYFKKQYAIDLNEFANLDFRTFLPFAKNFYTSRGTEDSLKFLFRAMFGEEIYVEYPGKYILRASDGKWNQEYHITIETLLGDTPFDNVDLRFNNEFGDFIISPTRVEKIPGSNHTLVYFRQDVKIRIVEGQRIFQDNRETGEVSYAGIVIPGVSALKIVDPGKYWQRGMVIRIPGTHKDTFARVTKVNSLGEVLSVEVLEFGYEHDENQTVTLSPFPNKPLGSSIDYNKELINASPPEYLHTLEITEYTDGIYDAAVGITDQQDYFLSDYFETGFFGKTAFSVNSGFNSNSISQDDGSGITINQWLESRALFTFVRNLITKDRGYYRTSESIISNKEIRLQDNNYYQIFSYVIETERELSEYRSALNLVHPAGTKFFADLTKTAYIEINPEVYRVMSNDLIQLIDPIGITEIFYKTVMKGLLDSQEITDGRPTFESEKVLDDDTGTLDEIVAKLVQKLMVDSNSVQDTLFIKSLAKVLADSYLLSDGTNKLFEKIADDSLTTTELLARAITKILSDSIDNSDSVSKEYAKALSDSFDSTDALTRAIEKTLADSINSSELLDKTIGKVVTDPINTNDEYSSLVEKLINIDQFGLKIEDTFNLTQESFTELSYFDDAYFITTKTLEIY